MIDKILFKTACPYYTFFLAQELDKMRMLTFKKWQIEKKTLDEINASSFAPSSVWQEWTNHSFVAVTSDGFLIKSGHNFNSSLTAPRSTLKMNLKSFIKNIIKFIKKDATNERIEHIFYSLYPNNTLSINKEIKEKYPFSYFTYLEAIHLSDINDDKIAPDTKSILEIGAGSGISIIHRERLGYGRQYIIDLPETIEIAFAFLCTLMDPKKIALPNEQITEDSQVIFCLPHQGISRVDNVDVAINVSSFQEMRLDVVNSYIALIGNKLKQSGYFVSSNQEKSRYIKNNEVSRWEFKGSKLKLITSKNALIQNQHAKANNLDLSFKCNVWQKY